MGYRSDVVFAVDKHVLALDLINPILPEVLRKEPYIDTDSARYWQFDGWKWYSGYEEVSSINNFMADLDELDIPDTVLRGTLYAGARIGEDVDDVETWGDYWEYDIEVVRTIHSPVPPF